MKTNLRLISFLVASAGIVGAAPLTSTTAVHTQPSESSPALSYLKAGTEPVADVGTPAPDGWMAVQLPGPIDGYVKNGDIMKSLDVRIGAPVLLSPKANGTQITRIEPGDRTDITGLHGKFTQIRLDKKVTGFIHVSAGSAAPVAVASAPVVTSAPLVDAAPVAPVAYGVTTAGRAAPMVNLGDGGSSTLPRSIQGRLVSTRSAFKPRRPYDWALNDESGKRYAYLDISRLLLTEQIEKYIDHMVVVYGGARAVPGQKDIVIEVESLQLK